MFGRAKDLVCGKKVKKKRVGGFSEILGKTYYFCSVSCRERFDKEPGKYMGDGKKRGSDVPSG